MDILIILLHIENTTSQNFIVTVFPQDLFMLVVLFVFKNSKRLREMAEVNCNLWCWIQSQDMLRCNRNYTGIH